MKLLPFLQSLHQEQQLAPDFFAGLVRVIRYAGPGRLLPAFFPEAAVGWENTCYAASEPGWKGSYQNISTRLEKKEVGWHITGSKSFILQAENLICLAKYENHPALVLLPFAALKNLKPLTSQGMLWPTRDGQVEHYQATLDSLVPEDSVSLIRQRDFLLTSARIPVIEFIGFVWLLLISENIPDSQAQLKMTKALQQSEKNALSAAREIFIIKRHNHSLPNYILPHIEPLLALYERLVSL